MMQFVKKAIEHTALAAIYRAARDEWRFNRREFADTSFGYRFAGPPHMIAGTFETEEREALQRHLACADLFVDIGANIGYFTCLACSMGKPVIAIEPLPGNLRCLCANLQANGWCDCVEIFPVGLAEKPGVASLYGAGTGASLIPGWAGASKSFQRPIPLSTLDILLGDRFKGKRLVIKMDVEGAEYMALRGASHIMEATPRPVWLVEITYSEHRGNTHNLHFLNTFELFRELGYEAVAVGQQDVEICPPNVHPHTTVGDEMRWRPGNYLFLNAEGYAPKREGL